MANLLIVLPGEKMGSVMYHDSVSRRTALHRRDPQNSSITHVATGDSANIYTYASKPVSVLFCVYTGPIYCWTHRRMRYLFG